MNYLVLIGDIVASKSIASRGITQDNLSTVLNHLSATNPNLVSPYTITLGDEFQAVFSNADSVFYETLEILSAVYPEKIRFSFGLGEIHTKINQKIALGMDGPAFYNARDGIIKLKNSGDLYIIEGLSNPYKNLIQESISLYSFTCKNWNKNRLQVFTSLCSKEKFQNMGFEFQNSERALYKNIAKELQISERSIYKNIAMGNFQNINRLLIEITKAINEDLQ